MTPESFLNGKVDLYCGDMLAVLPTLAENSIDSVCCDPPYHLTSIVQRFGAEDAAPAKSNGSGVYARSSAGFMGKRWDGGDIAFRPEAWRAIYRVIKPGAHLVAFGGTRTYHRMACAIEDAGFEIRDCIMWCYGSGFPKSHDVSKGIDRAAGMQRPVVGYDAEKARPNKENFAKRNDRQPTAGAVAGWKDNGATITAPATEAAAQWEGWGTALKPSHEDIVLAQKPFDLSGLSAILVRKIAEASCQLPSLAKAAGSNSLLSLSVFGTDVERGSAQWSAVLACNTLGDLFALMATLPSGSEMPSSLNIVLSWLGILADLLALTNTFTTETKTSLTTDLRTLHCLLSQNILDIIIGAATSANGTGSNALAVESIFNAVAARLKCTRVISAVDPVTFKDEGAGLLPDIEHIVLARKPLSESTVAANCLRWGTGALNVDGCRVAGVVPSTVQGQASSQGTIYGADQRTLREFEPHTNGRWPANLIHDGSEEVVAAFPDVGVSSGGKGAASGLIDNDSIYGRFSGENKGGNAGGLGDAGSAARFFYTAKADADDRLGSKHPTVKPVDLMQWLVRLVTPKGGTTLDPFAGTGTTGEAAWREGMCAVLIEREEEYQADIRRRMALALAGPDERVRESIKARGLVADAGPLFGGLA